MRFLETSFVGAFLDLPRCPADRPAIALVGRSNVGKSSLLNRLVGRKALARTSRTPGRTRELIYYAISTDRTQPFYLVDLPGYGYASGSREERESFARAARALLGSREHLSAVLLLVDAAVPWQESDLEMLDWLLGAGLPFALVFTKTDRTKKSAVRDHVAEVMERLPWREDIPVLATSARENEGIVGLRKWVASALAAVAPTAR